MKRLTLLLLLATTATCWGQTGEQILNSIGSSDMSADLALLESGKFIGMCQVSRGELRLIDGDAELNLDIVESAA